jgi:pyrroline-5-carboxylate reductase
MLVRKFTQTGAIEAEDILASNRTPEKADRLAEATYVATKGGITEAGVKVIQAEAPEMFDQLHPLISNYDIFEL